MSDLTRIFNRAKVGVMAKPDSTFFSTILFSLKHSWDETIPTACTNGINLRINPTWFTNMSDGARIGLLVHEVCHVAYQHMLRVGDRDFKLWNIATDYVINNLLVSRGFELPEDGLIDSKYNDMSSEQVYELLKQDPDQVPQNFQVDMEVPSGADGEPLSQDEQEAIEQEIQDIIIKAATQSKMQNDKPGTIPGDIEVMLQKLLNPKLPWYTILHKYMDSMAPEDYTFKRCNRRFLQYGIYLPTLYSESIGSIAVAVDTSGSVTDEQFTAFLTEINAIHERLKPKKLTVIDFDTRIHEEHVLTQGDNPARIKFHGRGGTCIEPVIDWAAEHKPNVLVIFTDGYFYQYDLDPKVPVIWVINNNGNFKYPYGKVIHFDP